MTVIQSNTLTVEQTAKIRELESACRTENSPDNPLYLTTELNFDKSIPAFYSAYENDVLAGFLTIFIPTREEAEITAVVRPEYRRRGIFTQLDAAVREVIKKNGIGRILYCVEAGSECAPFVLKSRGITNIQRSEYRMKVGKSVIKSYNPCAACSFSSRRVTEDNITDYINITNRSYGDEDTGYYDTVLTSDTRLGYVFYKENTPLGVFALGLENKGEPCIYGVAIAESERGNGYGKHLMKQACNLAISYGDEVFLDVDSENPIAFHLYKSIGFEIIFQIDYYVL